MRRALTAWVVLATLALTSPAGASHATFFTTSSFSGIRPGMPLNTFGGPDRPTDCTANFVFENPRTGRRYLGTAGHCLPGGFTPKAGVTWRYGTGPRVWVGCTPDALGRRWGNCGEFVGRAVYRSFFYEVTEIPGSCVAACSALISGWSTDFALIALARPSRARPGVAHFGGPTGVNRSHSDTARRVQHYGHGYCPTAVGFAPCPWHGRTGVVQGSTYAAGSGWVRFHSVITGGDSGSPLLDSAGRALGVIVALDVSPEGLDQFPPQHVHSGVQRAQRVDAELARAQERLRKAGMLKGGLRLLTAPF